MASLCWFGLSPLVWIQLLSVVVIGILVSVSYTLSIFHSVDGLEKPSSGMAMHELFLTVGILSGALFGGALLEKKGMVGVYAFVALILLVGLLIQFFLYKNREVTNTK
jgi:predicted MFS family arabinose efflux permease